MANTHIRFGDDENQEYEPSDSDDDYTDRDRGLLKKVRSQRAINSDSEEEVYGLQSDESGSEIALSDVEGQEEDDDLPNIRAWGKDRRKFYSTDYVDPDYGGFQGKDAALAEYEEEEARNLQRHLAQQLDDEDFSLDIYVKEKKVDDKIETEEIIKTDVSILSKRQKLELLKRDAPEFFGLVQDFKDKISIAEKFYNPIIVMSKDDKIKDCDALEFVKTHYELILNYCNNICMYLLLKASRVNIETHPVVKRLFQYRQLLTQIEPVFEEIMKPQIELLLKEQVSNEEPNKENKRKTLKLLAKLSNKKLDGNETNIETTKDTDEEFQPPKKKLKQIPVDNHPIQDESKSDGSNECDEEENDGQKTAGDEKRAITYQMAKNKGLTPHRKKDQRNPRVKHRNKFRKANIRRKGAVREVRKEVTRYGGEISGIKTTVTKSIKIKS